MFIAKVYEQGKGRDFAREFADDPHCLRLLRFFGEHPYTRFSRLAIPGKQSLDGRKSFLEKALKRLVDQGIVNECVQNGLSLYSLTKDETMGNLVTEMASLDWNQWRAITNTKKN
jgi:hypothetical protein